MLDKVRHSICGLGGWLGENPLGEIRLATIARPALAKFASPNSIISLKSLQLHSIDAFPLLNYAFSFAYALDVFVLAICLVIFLT